MVDTDWWVDPDKVSEEAQVDQDVGCDCQEVTSTSRRLEVWVEGCNACPFMHHVQACFRVEQTGEEIKPGWYCAHPRRRHHEDSIIASYQMVEDSPEHVASLDSWLRHHWRARFPGNCPLDTPDQAEEPTGVRALDIG